MQKMKHNETHAYKWLSLLPSVEVEMPGVLGTIIEKGGTRTAWQQIEGDTETMLMAYPAENYLRAGAILTGKAEGELQAVNIMPLVEGISNRLLMLDSYEWKNKIEGEVLVQNPAIEKSFWFYDPLFFRDKASIQANEPQHFILAGLVLGLREALLDELTITRGEAYEQHSMNYLAENPDKSRLDVPPLKISIRGQQVLGLGEFASEYQARATVTTLSSFEFGPEQGEKITIYSFIINIGTEESPMSLPLYISEKAIAKNTVLKEGMDVDLIFWLQGRIAD